METAYLSEELERRRLLLLGRIPGQKVAASLPSLDEELLLRAEEAISEKKLSRAAHLLEAMENRELPRWHLLRGTVCLRQKKWKTAANHLLKAEETFPHAVWPQLEICYRELGDFQRAYEYACKQKK